MSWRMEQSLRSRRYWQPIFLLITPPPGRRQSAPHAQSLAEKGTRCGSNGGWGFCACHATSSRKTFRKEVGAIVRCQAVTGLPCSAAHRLQNARSRITMMLVVVVELKQPYEGRQERATSTRSEDRKLLSIFRRKPPPRLLGSTQQLRFVIKRALSVLQKGLPELSFGSTSGIS